MPRRVAVPAAALVLAAPLAACVSEAAEPVEPSTSQADVFDVPGGSDEDVDGTGASESPSSPPAQVAIEAEVGPLAPEVPSAPDLPGVPEVPGDAPTDLPDDEQKVLKGGGFASAVPGSDAPDRKVDVGPQFAVSEDLDIEEIERLVAAVEKIARQQRVRSPEAVGGSVAAAVGTFSYRWFADGTVRPEPSWVAANIRTESVPILGSVTGHKVMLPQLRGALREIVARGLADKIHPEEYGGCYVPRFIGRDPAKGLSLHTWGIAIDLNVPGNLRGVPGEIDREVVAIFKKWGFAWGGDWAWTDPMHFELAQLVRPR